ncbi:MAG: RNA-binding S4 domain-containing protein, partial [Cetobacterium sp.]
EYFSRYFKFKILEVPEGNVSKSKTSELVELIDSKGIIIDLDGEEDIF